MTHKNKKKNGIKKRRMAQNKNGRNLPTIVVATEEVEETGV